MDSVEGEDSDNPDKNITDPSNPPVVSMSKSSLCSGCDSPESLVPAAKVPAGVITPSAVSDVRQKKTIQLRNAKFNIDKLKSFASNLPVKNWRREDSKSADLSTVPPRDGIDSLYSDNSASGVSNSSSASNNDSNNVVNINSHSSCENYISGSSVTSGKNNSNNPSHSSSNNIITIDSDKSSNNNCDKDNSAQEKSLGVKLTTPAKDIIHISDDEEVDVDIIGYSDDVENVHSSDDNFPNKPDDSRIRPKQPPLLEDDGEHHSPKYQSNKNSAAITHCGDSYMQSNLTDGSPTYFNSNNNVGSLSENDTSFYTTSDNEPLVLKIQQQVHCSVDSKEESKGIPIERMTEQITKKHRKSFPKKKKRKKATTGKHKCAYCSRSYPTMSQLVVHTRYHTGEEPFSCSYCDRKFKTSSHRKYHESSHITQGGIHACQDTSKSVVSCESNSETVHQSLESAHSKENDTEDLVDCNEVKKTTAMHDSGNKNVDASLKNKAQVSGCSEDGKKASDKLAKKRPLDADLEPTPPKHARHSTDEEEILSLECLYCERVFKSPSLLEYHEWTHGINKSFNCKTCGKSFRTVEGWKRHMKFHTKQVAFLCQYCQKSFSSKSNKTAHERKRCPVRRKRTYPCQHCGLVFADENVEKLHEEKCAPSTSATATGSEPKDSIVFQKSLNSSPEKIKGIAKKKKMKKKKKKSIPSNHKSSPQHFMLTKKKKVKGYLRYGSSRFPFDAEDNRCPICEKKFSCKGNINRHLKVIHPMEWMRILSTRTSPRKEHHVVTQTVQGLTNLTEDSSRLTEDVLFDSVEHVEKNILCSKLKTHHEDETQGACTYSQSYIANHVEHVPSAGGDSNARSNKVEYQATKALSPDLTITFTKKKHQGNDETNKEGPQVLKPSELYAESATPAKMAEVSSSLFKCHDCHKAFPTWKERRHHWKREHQPGLGKKSSGASISSQGDRRQEGKHQESTSSSSLTRPPHKHKSSEDKDVPLEDHQDGNLSSQKKRLLSQNEQCGQSKQQEGIKPPMVSSSWTQENWSSLDKYANDVQQSSVFERKRHRHSSNSKHSSRHKHKKRDREFLSREKSQIHEHGSSIHTPSGTMTHAHASNHGSMKKSPAKQYPDEISVVPDGRKGVKVIKIIEDGTDNKKIHEILVEVEDPVEDVGVSKSTLSPSKDLDKSGSNSNFAAMGLFQCEHCGEIFTKKSVWQEHLTTHGVSSLPEPSQAKDLSCKCQVCHRSFKTKYDRIKHEKRVHTNPVDRPFKCKYCAKTFALEPDATKHEISTHDAKIASHACRYCHLTFPTVRRCMAHEAKHSGGNKGAVQCRHCPRVFTTKYFRSLHEKRAHTRGTDKTFSCRICMRNFDQEILLRLHVKKKHKKKLSSSESGGNTKSPPQNKFPRGLNSSFSCQHCGQTLSCHRNYVEHLRWHVGEKPFKCDFCPKRFTRKSNCTTHEKNFHADKLRRRLLKMSSSRSKEPENGPSLPNN